MRKQTGKRRLPLPQIIIAAILACGAHTLTFAQDKYPKPDFKALEEYYQVVKSEYDFNTNVPTLVLVVKRKEANPPRFWIAEWLDADGVHLQKTKFVMDWVWNAPVDEPFRVSVYSPWKRDMSKVKRSTITEDPDR